MARGLVSVILPTYNRAGFLPAAIDSVIAQAYRPLELIVIDDGSADDTISVVAAMRSRIEETGIDLTFRWQPNAGAAAARNKGLKFAQGDFVCFLDSDDTWKPQFVTTLRRLFDQFPTTGLAFSNCACTEPGGRNLRVRQTHLPVNPEEGLLVKPFSRIVEYMPLTTPSVMVRRDVIDVVGPFDCGLQLGEDWDLWYRISRQFDFSYTQQVNTICLEHASNAPKSTTAALADKVRLNRKHLAATDDAAVRQVLNARIRRDGTLLQEQALREGLSADAFAYLLRDVDLPRSWRFSVGSAMRRQPRWLGRGYAGLVRAVGSVLRGEFRE